MSIYLFKLKLSIQINLHLDIIINLIMLLIRNRICVFLFFIVEGTFYNKQKTPNFERKFLVSIKLDLVCTLKEMEETVQKHKTNTCSPLNLIFTILMLLKILLIYRYH